MSQVSRPVARMVTPEPVIEGAGVHLRRSIGTRGLDHLDPFLLLDHFESANPPTMSRAFPIILTAVSRRSPSSGKGRSSTRIPWVTGAASEPVTFSG